MIELIENPLTTNVTDSLHTAVVNDTITSSIYDNPSNNIKQIIENEYCKFDVKLPNDTSIILMLHKKDTLSELHQKLVNRLRTCPPLNKEFDDIPSKTYNYSNDTSVSTHRMTVHDIFVCQEDSSEIVSIPSNKTVTITNFIDSNKKFFQNKKVYTIYVIDKEYYTKWVHKQNQPKSIFTHVKDTLVSYIM